MKIPEGSRRQSSNPNRDNGLIRLVRDGTEKRGGGHPGRLFLVKKGGGGGARSAAGAMNVMIEIL